MTGVACYRLKERTLGWSAVPSVLGGGGRGGDVARGVAGTLIKCPQDHGPPNPRKLFFKKNKKTETEVDEEGGGKGGGAPRRTFAGEGHGVHRVAVVVADVILVAPHFVQANADLACICSVFRVEVRGRREQGERERACVKRRGCGGGSLAGLFLHH